MDKLIRRILIAAGAVIGVTLVMCLASKVMMAKDSGITDSSYQDALDKLKDGDADKADKAGDLADADAKTPAGAEGSEQSGTDGTAQEGSETSEGSGENISGTGDTPEITAEPTAEPTKAPVVSGHVVVLDAAHQKTPDSSNEPIGPGSDQTKIKVHSGATGVSTGVPEYKLVLELTLALRDELISRGYSVYMIREDNDVSISDAERAKIANEHGDIVIHVHANADDREGIDGIMAFYPSKDNEFAASLSEPCRELSDDLLTGLGNATEARNWGCIALDTQTALNWTKIPAAHIEVGYLSNPEEDERMATASYRLKIVSGLADGVDIYFDKH